MCRPFEAALEFPMTTATLRPALFDLGTYSLSAVQLIVTLRSLSSTLTFIIFPSRSTVMRETVITLPLRMSVSSIVFPSIFFKETPVIPGSPLKDILFRRTSR